MLEVFGICRRARLGNTFINIMEDSHPLSKSHSTACVSCPGRREKNAGRVEEAVPEETPWEPQSVKMVDEANVVCLFPTPTAALLIVCPSRGSIPHCVSLCRPCTHFHQGTCAAGGGLQLLPLMPCGRTSGSETQAAAAAASVPLNIPRRCRVRVQLHVHMFLQTRSANFSAAHVYLKQHIF